ncbi:hypothetical protein HPB48_016600 [Haemaphysalis longicornis]|uniref:Uncharacterized protein n=1 Tax=Haemaphysalis longicornis TaxID=44386 RepID=A0A9J6GE67_HAELO|nr:hypothetical protein HPB48_016600 [Haemaphysalis longicornis]
MVRAWYMDDDLTVDQREEHQLSPPVPASLDEIRSKSGVLYWKVCDTTKTLVRERRDMRTWYMSGWEAAPTANLFSSAFSRVILLSGNVDFNAKSWRIECTG